MAELVSPGVSITVTDESFYASAGTGTVPLIVIATAEDKSRPDGAGLAAGTTSDTAGQVSLITSQRELITRYGNPIYKSLNGTALPGHELNEHGLLTAYSFLGIANRAYVLRADLDLNQLEGSSSAPSEKPDNGAVWFNTATSVWGLKRWNGTTWVRIGAPSSESPKLHVPSAAQISNGAPRQSFGKAGEFAVVYEEQFDSVTGDKTGTDITFWQKILNTSSNSASWYQVGSAGWVSAAQSFLGISTPDFQIGDHVSLSAEQKSTGASLEEGDIALQTNSIADGTSLSISDYVRVTDQFVEKDYYGADYSYQAYAWYNNLGGVNTGDLWVDYDSTLAVVRVFEHNGERQTVAESTVALSDTEIPTTGHVNGSTAMTISVNGRDLVNGANGSIAVTFYDYDSDAEGNLSVDDMVLAISDAIAGADPLSLASDVSVENNNGKIRIVSESGYDIKLEKGTVTSFDPEDLNLVKDVPYSNWEALIYEASATEITGELAEGTLWYDSLIDADYVDLLYNNAGSEGGEWTSYDLGDITVSASEPVSASTNDIWVSTADLENYPQLYKYVNNEWSQIDTADNNTRNGVVFADFRTGPTASYIDADAPDPDLYPFGILAWNKRASGGNVKRWTKDIVVRTDDSTGEVLEIGDRWVDFSGNKPDGSPYMLRKAQRAVAVRQMQAAIVSNTEIRNETNRFNLIAAPGYPELLDEMVSLNVDRKETAFIVADAPLRLSADSTSTQAWATNANNATGNGEDALITNYPYSAVYYPHGVTSNLDGQDVVVPSSYIALRTLAYNDQVAFPWFAPAGFQRGVVTNATSVGYIDAATSEFVPVSLNQGQRDSLYINKINPIANFPGRGLNVFGQKTLNPVASALDRVNVARLVVYVRERLDDIVKPFLFEPNDEITRANAKVVVDRFLANLIAQRGLYDFVTVCDLSNNTPDRIDRNELHIDVAIQPVKAVEFIYIPIRIQNTLGSAG